MIKRFTYILSFTMAFFIVNQNKLSAQNICIGGGSITVEIVCVEMLVAGEFAEEEVTILTTVTDNSGTILAMDICTQIDADIGGGGSTSSLGPAFGNFTFNIPFTAGGNFGDDNDFPITLEICYDIFEDDIGDRCEFDPGLITQDDDECLDNCFTVDISTLFGTGGSCLPLLNSDGSVDACTVVQDNVIRSNCEGDWNVTYQVAVDLNPPVELSCPGFLSPSSAPVIVNAFETGTTDLISGGVWSIASGGGTIIDNGDGSASFDPSGTTPGTSVQLVYTGENCCQTITNTCFVSIVECPSIVSPRVDMDNCTGEIITLQTNVTPATATVNEDYVLAWLEDGVVIPGSSTAGADGTPGTADDLVGYVIDPSGRLEFGYTLPMGRVTGCNFEDRVYTVELFCITDFVLDQGDPALTGTDPANTVIEYNSAGLTCINLDLTSLPACALASNFDFTTTVSSGPPFGASWICEAVLDVFQPTGSAGQFCDPFYAGSCPALGSNNTCFGGPTGAGTNSFVGSSSFGGLNSTTAAAGVWQLCYYDSFNDNAGATEGVVNHANLTITGLFPPGCSINPTSTSSVDAVNTFGTPLASAPVTDAAHPSGAGLVTGLRVCDSPLQNTDFVVPSGCMNFAITDLCGSLSVGYATSAAGPFDHTLADASSLVTPADGEVVFYEIYLDVDGDDISDCPSCATVTGSWALSLCPSCILPTLSATTTLGCKGDSNGSIDLDVTPNNTGDTFTFLWDDPAASTSEDISNLAAGTYTVTVTVNGDPTCTTTLMVELEEIMLGDGMALNVVCLDNGNDTATPTDPSDDVIMFDLTVAAGMNTGSGFQFTSTDPNVSGGTTLTYGVTHSSFLGSPGSAGGGDIILTIMDIPSGCETQVTVTDPGSCAISPVNNVCDCTNSSSPYTINVVASGGPAGSTLLYVLVDNDNGDAVLQNNQTGMFMPVPDNTMYTVHAFNVLDGELTAFTAALPTSITGGDDILTMTGTFENFCYELSEISFDESCNCCPDLTMIPDGDLMFGVTNSECTDFGGMPMGGMLTPPMDCPAGSSLEYSVNGGAFQDMAPMYNQTTTLTINVRCACISDPTVVSAAQETVTDPGECPPCPDLSGVTAPQANIKSESTCRDIGGGQFDLDGGIITAPVAECDGTDLADPDQPCPAGTRLEYMIPGWPWTEEIPEYDQSAPVTIRTRCVCENDDSIMSATCEVTTTPGMCPTPPEPVANVCDCTLENPLTINKIASNGGQADHTLIYSLSDGTMTSEVQTPAAGTNASFPGLMSGTTYEVCVYNVLDDADTGGTNLSDFNAAIDAAAMANDFSDANNMTDDFMDLCYEVTCMDVTEDCGCDAPQVTVDKNDNDNGDDTQGVPIDGTAEFTIEICNTGTEALCEISVDDSASETGLDLTDCEPSMADLLALVELEGNMNAELDPDECISFTCTVENINANFVNTIRVEAVGCISDLGANDEDDSDVTVGCPADLANFVTPAVIIESESVCVDAEGPTLGNGLLSAPTVACPTGSTLEYLIEGQSMWSTTLPTYDQFNSITVLTRCNCDADPSISSDPAQVTTTPGMCPEIPANECDCDLAPTPLTINKIAVNGNQPGYSIVYSLLQVGTTNQTFTNPMGGVASFPGLTDGVDYQFCAYNVLDSEIADFTAALNSAEAHEDAADGTFINPANDTEFCYTVSCEIINEDCDCCIANAGDQSTASCQSYCADDIDAEINMNIDFGPDGPAFINSIVFFVTDINGIIVKVVENLIPNTLMQDIEVGDLPAGDYCIHSADYQFSDPNFSLDPFAGDISNLLGLNLFDNVANFFTEVDGLENLGSGEICGDVTIEDCTPFSILAPITFDAVAICRELTEINDAADLTGTEYYIEVTNVQGGTGNYTIDVGGITTPPVNDTYGPFTHSGTGTATTTVTVSDDNAGNANCVDCMAIADVLETICAETVCDCDENPTGGAILAQSTEFNAVDHCMLYTITNPDGTVVVNETGFYEDLADGTYTVCAFNVLNTDKAAFRLLLVDGASVATAAALDPSFAAFCYDAACYEETVECFPDPTIVDVKLECSAIGGTVSLSTLFTDETTPGGTFAFGSTAPTGASINGGTLSYGEAGCYEIVYTVGEICPLSSTAFICIPEQPQPSFDLTEEVCWDGTAGSLSLPTAYDGLTSANFGTVTYAWTVTTVSGAGPVPTITTPTDQQPTISIQGAGQFEICLAESVMTDPCGTLDPATCSATTCQLLTVTETNVEVVADWTPFGPVCSDSPIVDLDALVVGDMGGVFTGEGVSAAASGNPDYEFDPSVIVFDGETSVDVTICYTVGNDTDNSDGQDNGTGAGCTGVECHDIRVYAPVDATLDDLVFDCTIAPSGNISLDALFTTTTTPGGVFAGTGVVGGNTLQYNDAGCYTITYTIDAFDGAMGTACSATATAFILIPEQPQPSFDMTEEVCWDGIPGSVTLSTIYNGQTSGNFGTVAYTWTVSTIDGIGQVPTITNTDDQEPLISIQGAGQFEICLTESVMTAACSDLAPVTCNATTCQILTVTETNVAVVADWTPFGPLCVDSPIVDLDELVNGDANGVFTGVGVSPAMSGHPDYEFDPSMIEFKGQEFVDVTICYIVGNDTDDSGSLEDPPVDNRLLPPDLTDGAATWSYDNFTDITGAGCGSNLIFDAGNGNNQGYGVDWFFSINGGNSIQFPAPNPANVNQTAANSILVLYEDLNGITGLDAFLTVTLTEIAPGDVQVTQVMQIQNNTGSSIDVSLFNYLDLDKGTSISENSGISILEDGCNFITEISDDNSTDVCYFAVNGATSYQVEDYSILCDLLIAGTPSLNNSGLPLAGDHTQAYEFSGTVASGDFINAETLVTFGNPPEPAEVDPVTGLCSFPSTPDPEPMQMGPGTGSGCDAVECHTIRVYAPVDATLEDLVFDCTIAPSGNISLDALFTENTTAGGSFSGAGVFGNTLQYNGPGCFEITYTILPFDEATGACTATATAFILIPEQPQPSFDIQDQVCFSDGDVATHVYTPIVNSPSYDSDAANVVTTWAIASGLATVAIDGEVTITGTGVVEVCMTETITTPGCGGLDDEVCEETFCIQIQVSDGTAQDASFMISAQDQCPGETIILTANTNGGEFSGDGVTDDGNGMTASVIIPGDCSSVDVTYTLNDPNGCTSSATQTVFGDRIDPTFISTPPMNATVECGPDNATELADWLANNADAVAMDNCDVAITSQLINTISGCGGTSESVYAFTATDACENTTTLFASFIIQDTTIPVIETIDDLTLSCADISETTDPFLRIEDWLNTNFTASDICGDVTVTHDYDPTTLNVCIASTTTVTWTATDECGLVNTATAMLFIEPDTGLPVIQAPDDITFDCSVISETSSPAAMIDSLLAEVIVMDNCDTDPVLTSNFDRADINVCADAPYDITITWNATDACGNQAVPQMTMITIMPDTDPPVLTVPDDLTITCTEISGTDDPSALLAAFLTSASAMDACDSDPVITHDYDGSQLDVCTEQFIEVEFTATDACGNSTMEIATIEVIPDMTAPDLDCPPGTINNTDFYTCEGDIEWLHPLPTDECGILIYTFSVTDPDGTVNGPFDLLEILSTGVANTTYDFEENLNDGTGSVVSYYVEDACGNSDECSFDVFVLDDLAPYFADCPAMIMVGNDPDQCSAFVNWDVPIAFDNCDNPDGNVAGTEDEIDVVQTEGPLPGTEIEVGTHLVTYMATDDDGNVAICTFEVIVKDTECPEFITTLPEDVTVDCDAIPEPFEVIPQWHTSDNCTESIDVVVDFDEVRTDGDCPFNFELKRTWTITDEAGNSCEHNQKITVIDTIAPVLTIPEDMTIESCPVAFDTIVVPRVMIVDTIEQLVAIGDDWVLTQVVNKKDTFDLVITPIFIDPTEGFDATATDNCSADEDITITVREETEFICKGIKAAVVLRIFEAEDECGNITTDTMVIEVLDPNPPVLAVFDTITVSLGPDGKVDLQQEDVVISLFDACFGDDSELMVEISPNFFNCSDIGQHTVLVSATDPCNNMTAFEEVIVNIIDITPPSVICPGATGPVDLNINPSNCDGTFGQLLDILDGNDCDVNIFTDPPLDAGIDITTDQITIFAIDASGNASSCVVDVNVSLTEPIDFDEVLSCNDQINVSLNGECWYELVPDILLEGDPQVCTELLCIEVTDSNGDDHLNFFDETDVDELFRVRVVDCNGSGNSCWVDVRIEEKQIPQILFPADTSLLCVEPTDTSYFKLDVPQILNCEPVITIEFEDEYVEFDRCSNPRATITRKWTVTDDEGNSEDSTQIINILPFSNDHVVFPDDISVEDPIDCRLVTETIDDIENNVLDPTSKLHPDSTGLPNIFGLPLQTNSGLCLFSMGYEDRVLEICSGSYQILRKWEINDVCSPYVEGVNPVSHTQVITVFDDEGPVLEEDFVPVNDTLSYQPWTCAYNGLLPVPGGNIETCGDIFFNAYVTGGGFIETSGTVQGGDLEILAFDFQEGDHWITYVYEDGCNNISLYKFIITIVDEVPPIAVCQNDITVTVSTDGLASISASDIDAGSNDSGCGPVTSCIVREIDFDAGFIGIVDGFKAYVAANTCQIDGEFRDTVFDDKFEEIQTINIIPFVLCKDVLKICCDDLGTQSIVLNVTDNVGLSSTCVADITIEDKSSDILVCEPHAISCTADKDDDLLPAAGISTICGDDLPLLFTDTNEFIDDCGDGQIFRIWYLDDNGNGTLDDDETSCNQLITVTNPSLFDPFTIKWPKHYTGEVLPGTNIECDNDDEVVEQDTNVSMGDKFSCSATDPGDIPLWCKTSCGLVGLSSEIDTVTAGDACLKLIKRWTVIDWCYWEANGGTPGDDSNDTDNDIFEPIEDWAQGVCAGCPEGLSDDPVYFRYVDVDLDGYYTFDQVIEIVDDTAPTVSTSDVVVSTSGGASSKDDDTPCTGTGTVTATASDSCGDENITGELLSWTISYNNGASTTVSNAEGTEVTIETQAGSPGEVHTATFTVQDGCGNSSSAVSTITFGDDKNPVPLCIAGVTTAFVEQTGTVEVWAKDFDLGSFDNCTEVSFTVARSGTDPDLAEANITFSCDDLESLYELDVWVSDENGNRDFCTVSVLVGGSCDFEVGSSAILAGRLFTEDGDMVDQAEVTVAAASLSEYPISMISNENGAYAFPSNPVFEDYNVSVLRDGDYLNGVTTADLIAIQSHIVGLRVLESPYKVIAADINNDESVSVLDVVVLRNVILGISRRFSNNTSWRFVDEKQEFPDVTQPWPFTEILDYQMLSTDRTDENFIAVKIGDLNATTTANNAAIASSTRSNSQLAFAVKDIDVEKGEQIRIDVTANEVKQLTGFQFTMEHKGLTYKGVESGEIEISDSNIGVHENAITASWGSTSLVETDGTLFTIVFDAKSPIRLSDRLNMTSSITKAEVYTSYNDIYDLGLNIDQGTVGRVTLEQNDPNPFAEQTEITFSLPKANEATLTVYNVDGKAVKKIKGEYAKGLNKILLKRDDLDVSSGVLYYQLTVDDVIITKKMIAIQ